MKEVNLLLDEVIKTKQCTKCKEVKPVTEFYASKTHKGGCTSWCKLCMKVYYQTSEHKAYMKVYDKSRWQTPQRKVYMKAYQQTSEYKAYCQTPKYKAKRKSYWQTPKGKANKARKNHKRRTLMKELPCNLTAEQWEEIKASQDYRCAICGEVKPLERDHIFPLSKGGAFTKDNIQGLCRSCNSSKGARVIRAQQQMNLSL